MPAIEQLLVIVLLLTAAVVFGYFYVKRAQARPNAKATAPQQDQEPVVFKAPMATEPPAPSRTGEEAPAAPPPAEPSASAPASSDQPTDERDTTG